MRANYDRTRTTKRMEKDKVFGFSGLFSTTVKKGSTKL